MKRYFILIILQLFLFHTSNSQTTSIAFNNPEKLTEINDTTKIKLAKVKSCKIEYFSNDTKKERNPWSTTFVNFRKDGNQSAKIDCGFYGSPLQSCYNTLYFYDSLHNLIKVLEYTPDSTLAKRTIYYYTGKYLIKKKEEYLGTGYTTKDSIVYSDNWTIKNKYEEFGSNERIITYNDNGKPILILNQEFKKKPYSKILFEYDHKGNLLKLSVIWLDELDTKNSYNSHSLIYNDSLGRTIKSEAFSDKNKDTYTEVFEYDSTGNIIKKETFNGEDLIPLWTEITYYNEFGLPVKEERYQLSPKKTGKKRKTLPLSSVEKYSYEYYK